MSDREIDRDTIVPVVDCSISMPKIKLTTMAFLEVNKDCSQSYLLRAEKIISAACSAAAYAATCK